ncbi:MAG: CHAT domain-containing protein [Pseudomonadota bacterium]
MTVWHIRRHLAALTLACVFAQPPLAQTSADAEYDALRQAIQAAPDLGAALGAANELTQYLTDLPPAAMPEIIRRERLALAHLSLAQIAANRAFGMQGQVFAVESVRAAAWHFAALGQESAAAELNLQLSQLIYRLPPGQLANHDQKLRDAYDGALAFYTEDAHPNIWAQLKSNLVEIYMSRTTGDRALNVNQAIAHGEDALRVNRKETRPVDWAATQANLAYAYGARRSGDILADLDTAIERGHKALEVFQEQDNSFLWALVHMNLSDAYFRRSGEVALVFLEPSAHHARQAMRVYTADAYPRDWVQLNLNLNKACFGMHRRAGDGHLDCAQRALEDGLTLATHETFFDLWVHIKIDMARVLSARARQDPSAIQTAVNTLRELEPHDLRRRAPQSWAHAEHTLAALLIDPSIDDHAMLERAVEAGDNALSIYTKETAPYRWATTKINQGVAYARLSTLDARRTDDALRAFRDAQSVLTPEVDASEWARLQFRQASLLMEANRGHRSDTSAAIDLIQNALEVLSPDSQRLLWAEGQARLAEAYLTDITGDQSANRALAETALRRALDHLTSADDALLWGHLHGLLGIAVGRDPDLPYRERMAQASDLIGRAMEYVTPQTDPYGYATLQASLAFTLLEVSPPMGSNLDAALDAARTALQGLDPQRDPDAWVVAMRNLASVHQRRTFFGTAASGPSRADYAEAIDAYDQALEETPAATRPWERLLTLAGRIQIESEIGDWPAVAAMGEDVAATLGLLLDQLDTEEEIRDAVRRAEPALSLAAYARVQTGDPARAFALLELTRAVLAARTFAPADDLTAAEQDRLRTLREELAALRHKDGPAVQIAQQRLRSQITQLRARPGNQAAHLTPPSGVAFLTMVAVRNGGAVILRTKDDFFVQEMGPRDYAVLAKQIYGGIGQAETASWDWGRGETSGQQASQLAVRVWQVLDQAALPRDMRLVWVPPVELFPIPLSAGRHPIVNRHLIDAYEVIAAPSFRIWNHLHARPAAGLQQPTVAGIFNPTGDLLYAGAEEHLIAGLAPDMALTSTDAGIRAEGLLDAFAGRDIWHFATHNAFDWARYFNSGLDLGRDAKGAAQRLTIEDLLYLSPPQSPQLVMLTVCESGLSDVKHYPDELTGLPTAFLAMGARGVISAKWDVNDLATALLVARFYDVLATDDIHPATALRRAQIWLRDASGMELFDYVQGAQRALSTDSALRGLGPLIGALSAIANQAEPFRDERYWAGFVYIGA